MEGGEEMKRKNFRLRWWIALGIAVAAIIVPVAQAQPLGEHNGWGIRVTRQHVNQPVVTKSSNNGTNWTLVSAIVGSVGVLSLLAATAAAARSRRIVFSVR